MVLDINFEKTTAPNKEFTKLADDEQIQRTVQALETRNIKVLIASNTGSQLGPYASGAGKVIWVVGAQKLVRNLEEGMRRIEEYCVPREEVHMQQLYGSHTGLNKILIVNKEIRPERITMIIVKEQLGY